MRAAPPLAATVTANVPVPVALGDRPGWSSTGTADEGLQVQVGDVVTVKLSWPPAAGALALSGATVYRHGAAACSSSMRASLTTTAPLRMATSGLACAVTLRVAGPWPLVGLTTIHAAWLAAVQVHSRFVETPSELVPPLTLSCVLPVSAIAHLLDEGPVTLVDDDRQLPSRADSARATTSEE